MVDISQLTHSIIRIDKNLAIQLAELFVNRDLTRLTYEMTGGRGDRELVLSHWTQIAKNFMQNDQYIEMIQPISKMISGITQHNKGDLSELFKSMSISKEVFSEICAKDNHLAFAAIEYEIFPLVEKYQENVVGRHDFSVNPALLKARGQYAAARGLVEIGFTGEELKKYNELLVSTKKYMIGAEEGLSSLQLDREKFAMDARTTLEDAQKDTNAKLSAYLQAQREATKITGSVALWKTAKWGHRAQFGAGLLLMIGGIAWAASWTITNLKSVLADINFTSATGAATFTPAATLTLAITIAFITAAGFVVRIMGRFVTNSLTMAEDASIRAALADTFLNLVAEDTKLDEPARNQARTIMLAALFRPLPGHQQEELQAPTVLAMAQDMLKGSKTS